MAKWIQKATAGNTGALRRQLKVKKGKTIPVKTMNKKLSTLKKKKKKTAAEQKLQKRLVLAKTLRGITMKRKKKKK